MGLSRDLLKTDLGKILPKDSLKECRQTNACYIFFNEPLPWSQAVEVCREYNGTIISISSPDENEWIAARLKKLEFPGVFLDLRFDDQLQSYISLNGSLSNYINIHPNNEVFFGHKNDKNKIIPQTVHSRQKRHIEMPIRTKMIITFKKRKWRKRTRTRNVYHFRYNKFIDSYKRKIKKKINKYRIVVILREKKIFHENEKLFPIWVKRIEWLKKQNWEIWLKTILDIDTDLWIDRIKQIIEIIDLKHVSGIKPIWTTWWRQIVTWYKEWIKQYSKKQIDIIWRWKQFVIWLHKNNWNEIIQQINGIDRSLWIARIKRIIWIVEQRKYKQICDEDWMKWKVMVESWIKMINIKRIDILDNDLKRVVIIKWQKRMEWIRRHHVVTKVKFGHSFSTWKEEALTQLSNMTEMVNNYKVEDLMDQNLSDAWQKIKQQIEQDVTTTTDSSEDVQTYLNWINQLHWLQANNIQYILKTNAKITEVKEYKHFVKIVERRKFSSENSQEISNSFNHLKILVEKQQHIAQEHLGEISGLRRKRSAINSFQIPSDISDKLDFSARIDIFQDATKDYPMLRRFLINELFKIQYLVTKLEDSDIEPHHILFRKLIRDHIQALYTLRLPWNLWKLMSTLRILNVSMNIRPGDCITMGNNGSKWQLWQQTQCHTSRPFICQIKS